MSGKEVFEITDKPIVCHAFNKDRTRVAISPNDGTVHVLKKSGAKWETEVILKEHTQVVTGIDWGAETNRIVTCGADRNGYVWVEGEDGVWKPTLVILRINRAATDVKWSPKEDKFAVASGSRLISVCYYENENQWWVSKHIKKPIRSTVLAVDWHPNNILIAAGSTDFKCRVFSAYIKEIEAKPEATNWGKKMPFGHLMAEFSNGRGGWVHSVAFSPSGSKVAWTAHDSSVSVVTGGEGAVPAVHNTKELPLLTALWLSENTLVTGGHNMVPMVFRHSDDNTVTFQAKLDGQPAEKGDEEETMSAMARFRNLDKRATGKKDDKASTTHVNIIKQISMFGGERDSVEKVSSCGLDGKIVIWNIKSLEASIAELTIA